ncbi:unnamed protein product [Darwinula stevensoni]|uniref:Uncharacterized protein n=1 Tax=Darwinula stevensoni TaxID=69355 RepID=A0A7R9ABF8_9CRUS|nr:unnamed protein product [Darwinula stevensoni]CAG0899184.1 unnamed protein product [Darwinula stevensoni]
MKRSVVLLVLSLAMSWAERQVATIYDLVNLSENGTWNERVSYCPDFRDCDPLIGDDMISSACVQGVDYYYNHENNGTVEWGFGDGECWNLQYVNDQVSSLRYVGDAINWKENTMNLYQFDYFSGLEYFAFGETPELPGYMTSVDSLIITGDIIWSVFSGENFTGELTCFAIHEGYYVGFAADLSLFGIQTIKSFRPGCVGARTILLD